MSIQLVTYANQTVTPTNDAIIYERAIDQNGIFYGCNVTVSGNEVLITGGYGIVCGREFVIQSESIAVTLAPSGTLDGRLYVRLDLADADAPIQLLTSTGNTLPPLEQDDDVNYTNGAYEMELATFTVGVSSLSDVTETYETIYGIKSALKVTSPTVAVTASTGSVKNVYAVKTGNVMVLQLEVYNTSSVGSGSNVFVGTISSTSYRPKVGVTSGTFYGARAVNAQVNASGGITVRNVGSSSMSPPSNDPVTIAFTYIVA